MIRPDIRRWDATVWLKVSPKNIHSCCRCDGIVCPQSWVKYIYHYLDDFAVLGSPDSEGCHRHLLCLQSVAADLGVPLAPDKQDGPTTVIVFLGIIIDTTRQELRLPEDKLRRLLETVMEWNDRKVCTHRDMESLVGML